ncbi:MAG: GNAT family acetyltransferase [Lachnospiraceae bacterium]
MIERKDLLSMPYYKKTHYTGSYKGMHYKIEKVEKDTAEGEKQPNFRVTIWPGPLNIEKTPDEKKQYQEFPFTKEGLDNICDWLNEQYQSQIEIWKKVSMWV